VEALPAFELASKWKGKGIFSVASAKIREKGWRAQRVVSPLGSNYGYISYFKNYSRKS
jgi:hypothetical protein